MLPLQLLPLLAGLLPTPGTAIGSPTTPVSKGFLGSSSNSATPSATADNTDVDRTGWWKDCTYEIMMVDDRTLYDDPDPEWFWAENAVINYAYAEKFGYNFNLVKPNRKVDKNGKRINYSVEWMRPLYIQEHLREQRSSAGCKWFLYLDSDAFVREFDKPLDGFLRDLASRYNIQEDVGVVVAQEHKIKGKLDYVSKYKFLNPGVMLVQANAHSQSFLDLWIEAGRHSGRLKNEFPREMGVMTHVWRKHPDKSLVAVVDMLEMNSPYGRFVEHAWHPSPQRRTSGKDMLVRINAQNTDRFHELIAKVRKHVVSWTADPF